MAIPVLQDLQRNPINYSAEYVKFEELQLKYGAITTTGNAQWTSPSSGITYPATTGGEAQLITLLLVNIGTSILNATTFNSIRITLMNQNRKLRMGVRV